MANSISKYRIDVVWPFATEEVRDAVVQFWRSEGALQDERRARQRSGELVVIGRNTEGAIVAVSTARRVHVEQLDLKCFYYRMFVGRTHRAIGIRSTDLVRQILLRTYQTLNDRFLDGHDSDCVGLYMEVENTSVKRHRNQTVWSDFGANAVYIGKTPKGGHARVWYFDGSRVST